MTALIREVYIHVCINHQSYAYSLVADMSGIGGISG